MPIRVLIEQILRRSSVAFDAMDHARQPPSWKSLIIKSILWPQIQTLLSFIRCDANTARHEAKVTCETLLMKTLDSTYRSRWGEGSSLGGNFARSLWCIDAEVVLSSVTRSMSVYFRTDNDGKNMMIERTMVRTFERQAGLYRILDLVVPR